MKGRIFILTLIVAILGFIVFDNGSPSIFSKGMILPLDETLEEEKPIDKNSEEKIATNLEAKSKEDMSTQLEAKVEKTTTNTARNTNNISKNNQTTYEDEVVTLINKERQKNGLAVLKVDREISKLTRIKSEDMRDNNYFATTSPTHGTLTDMLRSNGVQYRLASEKIAGGSKTPQEVFNSWMKDADFKKSIMQKNFTHLGVGYAAGQGKYNYYWTLWLVEKPSPIASNTKSNFEQEVLRLTNIERTSRGLNPLQWDDALAKAARAKSEDMRDKNYFAHESPTYGSLGNMLKSFNISYLAAAENLAAGQKTPEEAVKGWMNSKGHRENILNPNLTHLGVGYADGGGDYYTYWTQVFTTKP